MPRITPIHWKILACIFEKDGFVFEREASSHRSYVKQGVVRPIIIPKYNPIDVTIIRGLMKTAGMKRERYFELLRQCR